MLLRSAHDRRKVTLNYAELPQNILKGSDQLKDASVFLVSFVEISNDAVKQHVRYGSPVRAEI